MNRLNEIQTPIHDYNVLFVLEHTALTTFLTGTKYTI